MSSSLDSTLSDFDVFRCGYALVACLQQTLHICDVECIWSMRRRLSRKSWKLSSVEQRRQFDCQRSRDCVRSYVLGCGSSNRFIGGTKLATSIVLDTVAEPINCKIFRH